MTLLKCHAGVTSECCSSSSMASSWSHFRLIPLLSSDRSSNANIFPATLKTSAVSLKGKPSVTPGLLMQYFLISSMSLDKSMISQLDQNISNGDGYYFTEHCMDYRTVN